MKLDNLPWTRPDALFAIRASLVDNGNPGFHQLDGIFGAYADAAAAEVTLARHDMDHEWSFTHEIQKKGRQRREEMQRGFVLQGKPIPTTTDSLYQSLAVCGFVS